MPCRDPRDDPGFALNEARDKLDRVTALLCFACSLMFNKPHTYESYKLDELRDWYRLHNEADRRREEAAAKALRDAEARKERDAHLASVRERLKEQLTPEEKEALGL